MELLCGERQDVTLLLDVSPNPRLDLGIVVYRSVFILSKRSLLAREKYPINIAHLSPGSSKFQRYIMHRDQRTHSTFVLPTSFLVNQVENQQCHINFITKALIIPHTSETYTAIRSSKQKRTGKENV